MQHAFHREIDALYSDPALDRLLPDLAGRRRLGLIEQDLADLGAEPPAAEGTPAFPMGESADIPTALGWLYVAEGSNLGAAFLLKAAGGLGLSETFGARHLAAAPEGRGLHWKTFTAALDGQEVSEAEEARLSPGSKLWWQPPSADVGLDLIPAAEVTGCRPDASARTSPAPGWCGSGTTREVTVAEGFLWNGKTWTSLSTIAGEITGAHWSGPRFFGLAGGGKAAGQRKGRLHARDEGDSTNAQAPSSSAGQLDLLSSRSGSEKRPREIIAGDARPFRDRQGPSNLDAGPPPERLAITNDGARRRQIVP